MRKWPKSAREVSDENETQLRHNDAGCPKVWRVSLKSGHTRGGSDNMNNQDMPKNEKETKLRT